MNAPTIPIVCKLYIVPSVLVYRRNPKEKKETKEPDTAQKQQSTLKVTDQYIALLIRVFVAAGLLDVRHSLFLGTLGPLLMIRYC